MSRPANPKAMHGWFGYRHLPYRPGERGLELARDIVVAKLPKKEFFEVTAMAEAIRSGIDPLMPIFECCSGHGLLGMLLACDARVPRVVVLDRAFPPNRKRLLHTIATHHPDVVDRLEFVETDVGSYPGFAPGAFVAIHACGPATDLILEAAVRNRARFFVMTCCINHRVARRYGLDSVHGLEQEVNRLRLERAAAAGYQVDTLRIDARITPWNTILAGWPAEEPRTPRGGLRETPLPARLPPRLQAADASVQPETDH
jgi:hypothetical protein